MLTLFSIIIILVIIIAITKHDKRNFIYTYTYKDKDINHSNKSDIILTNDQYKGNFKGAKPNITFHRKEDTINLFGYNITDSLFYTSKVSSKLPFVINTKITPSFDIAATKALNYHPNYNELDNYQKGYFIKWLSEGKSYISELGFVYIYYYGLEYRALIEKQDQKEILFEVIDLLNKFNNLIYGYSLVAYLVLSIKKFSEDELKKLSMFFISNERYYSYDNSYCTIINNFSPKKDHVKFYPKQFMNDNEYVSFGRKSDLLSYYGNKITENKDTTKLYSIEIKKYIYRPALYEYIIDECATTYNAIIPTPQFKRSWNYGHKVIFNEIKTIIKKFDSSSAPLTEIEILAYLPSKLRDKINYSHINFDFGERTITNIGVITEKLGFQVHNKITLRQSILIVNACKAFGYNIEPCANINQSAYKQDSLVCIYKYPYEENLSSTNYLMALLFADIGYQIALEDNNISQQEIERIEKYVTKEFNLSTTERYRLQMKKELMLNTKKLNSNRISKKNIKILDEKDKEKLAWFIASVAIADGVVKSAEWTSLQKIFKELNFSEDFLNKILLQLINDAGDVVTIEKGSSSPKKGSKIPQEIEENKKIELKIDTSKLEKIKLNTSEIHNVLQKIFKDESDEIIQPKTIFEGNKNNEDQENDLQKIIYIIIKKDQWTHNELTKLSKNYNKMLNSLIDEINEWSEEEYGDFLIEEDDDIYTLNNDVVNLVKKQG